jgi:hypothetical protein
MVTVLHPGLLLGLAKIMHQPESHILGQNLKCSLCPHPSALSTRQPQDMHCSLSFQHKGTFMSPTVSPLRGRGPGIHKPQVIMNQCVSFLRPVIFPINHSWAAAPSKINVYTNANAFTNRPIAEGTSHTQFPGLTDLSSHWPHQGCTTREGDVAWLSHPSLKSENDSSQVNRHPLYTQTDLDLDTSCRIPNANSSNWAQRKGASSPH